MGSETLEDLEKYRAMKPSTWPADDEFSNDGSEAIMRYFHSKPLFRTEHPCKKIVFSFKSHDQGWGGDPGSHGTYHGSYTWFDVGLERFCTTKSGIIKHYHSPHKIFWRSDKL